MIIGITGKSGVGKTTFSTLLENYGFKIISVDDVSHELLLEPDIKNKIESMFNIKYDNTNRISLGDIVFNNRDKMKQVSHIIGNRIEEYIDEVVTSNNDVVIEWILLPKLKVFDRCDYKILIKSKDDKQRCDAVIKRDNIDIDYFRARESNSIEYREDVFDYTVNNWYDEETLGLFTQYMEDVVYGRSE